MIPVPALILFFILGGLASIHLYWAAGGKWGFEGAIPTREGAPLFKPGRALTLLVAGALGFGAVLALWRGVSPSIEPAWIPRVGVWIMAVVFGLRAIGDFGFCGLFKRLRDTRFARNDTLIFTPLCLLTSGMAVWLALGF